MKKLLSGIQASGKLHIGNYFGAIKQFVDLQDDYDASYMIADLHALTTVKDPKVLSENILDVYIDYLAVGLDASKSLVFKQSDAPQVAELTWIFNCLVTVPWLERAHSYKDKVSKDITPTVGLFNYPVLMGSDILIAEANVVPVGEDQRQHVEMARELARKFNEAYGEEFTEPEEMIMESVAVVPGIDGRKMSKSYGNTIPLFAETEELKSLAMSVVTASTPKGEAVDPETDNVYALYKLVATDQEIKEMSEGYKSGELGFKESKERLFEALERFIAPMRDNRKSIDKDQAKEQLYKAGEGASKIYEEKMKKVRKLIGVDF